MIDAISNNLINDDRCRRTGPKGLGSLQIRERNCISLKDLLRLAMNILELIILANIKVFLSELNTGSSR